MIYGMKPFNGAEMRAYLDIISEAPFTTNPKGVPMKTGQPGEPEQDFGTQVINKGFPMVAKGMTDLAPDIEKTLQNFTPGSEYYQKNVANNPELVKRAAEVTSQVQPGDFTKSVTDTAQKLNKVLNTPQADLGRSATSPEYDAVADKVGLPSVQEEMRDYLDMLEADDVTGHGQISTKDMGGGTKVSFDPATGGKTVSGAEGTTSYDVKGQKTSQASPNIGGFQKTTNYQTGEKTTTGQVGPVGISTTQRPDQSTVTTASVPLGHNVQATASKGIGFGGAGKDVQQGGNQITSITARTAKNPEGVTSSFTGMPTAQDLEKAIPDDWAASGNEFSDTDKVLEGGITSPALPKKGLNPQQKSVDQMPALFKPKGIKVLGNKKDPEHPAKGYFVGANESEQMLAAEDMLGKIRRDLTDYLRSVEDEIVGKDRSLIRKAKHDIMQPPLDQLVPAKTLYTDDGKEIKIHGNEDDGFRITVREKTLPTQFDSLEEAAMACEMYCAHRRGQQYEADSDYLDERDIA